MKPNELKKIKKALREAHLLGDAIIDFIGDNITIRDTLNVSGDIGDLPSGLTYFLCAGSKALPKKEPPFKTYTFKATTAEIDFERIERENHEEGTKAFIVEGPVNAVVGILGEEKSRAFWNNTWYWLNRGIPFSIKDGGFGRNAMKKSKRWAYEFIDKTDIPNRTERLSRLFKEPDKKHKVKVMTW